MKCFTDYPLFESEYNKIAPIREVELIAYDGDKYVRVLFEGKTYSFKSGYLYSKPGRAGEAPCVGEKIKEFETEEFYS